MMSNYIVILNHMQLTRKLLELHNYLILKIHFRSIHHHYYCYYNFGSSSSIHLCDNVFFSLTYLHLLLIQSNSIRRKDHHILVQGLNNLHRIQIHYHTHYHIRIHYFRNFHIGIRLLVGITKFRSLFHHH